MKSFLLAAFIGAVSAQDAPVPTMENATQVLEAPIVCTNGATATFSTLEQVYTGWTKNGAGTDAVLDMKLWMQFSGKFILRNANLNSEHRIAIANEAGDKYEAESWQFALPDAADKVNTTFKYMNGEGPMPESLANISFADGGSYTYKIRSGGVDFTDRLLNFAGQWNIDPVNSNYIKDTAWWLSLTRDSPGAADITTGATRSAKYYFNGVSSTKKSYPTSSDLTLSWAADTSVVEGDTTDTTDATDATDDTTDATDETTDETDETDEIDETDGTVNMDDGATAVTTFGAAFIAAVSALMF